MQGKVELCGVNTSNLPLLKNAEMRELIAVAQAGDSKARDKLINGNLRLVLSVIQKFSGRGESMDDLFQVGCIGLIKAIDCFDLSQNVQFSTYGVPMISGAFCATTALCAYRARCAIRPIASFRSRSGSPPNWGVSRTSTT